MIVSPPMCMCETPLSWCKNEASTGVNLSRWRWLIGLSVAGSPLQ
jgi:hypothetical protein